MRNPFLKDQHIRAQIEIEQKHQDQYEKGNHRPSFFSFLEGHQRVEVELNYKLARLQG